MENSGGWAVDLILEGISNNASGFSHFKQDLCLKNDSQKIEIV